MGTSPEPPSRPRWAHRLATMQLLLALVAVAFPGTWRWWLATLVGIHGSLLAGSLLPRSGWLGPNLRRLPPSARARREVALTFDDGPDPEVTPRVLEVLESSGAPATFFCIGERVERFPHLARQIIQRGHTIENHTQRHLHHFAFLGPRGQEVEIGGAQRTIERVCATQARFFRPPAGFRSPFTHAVLRRQGLRLVSWTRRGLDGVDGDALRVLSRLTRGLAPGAILLLHDGSSISSASASRAVETVLPALLREIAHQGLVPVTLAAALRA